MFEVRKVFHVIVTRCFEVGSEVGSSIFNVGKFGNINVGVVFTFLLEFLRLSLEVSIDREEGGNDERCVCRQ